MAEKNAVYLAQLRSEIRAVRNPDVVLAACPCRGDREMTEGPFIDVFAHYICDMQLFNCVLSVSCREYMLRSTWNKLLEYFTPECGVYRACREPYVLVALAGVELIPKNFPWLYPLALDASAAWMCSGPHNRLNFKHEQAFKYLSGLFDRSLVPPPPQNHFGCVGCSEC